MIESRKQEAAADDKIGQISYKCGGGSFKQKLQDNFAELNR